MTKDVTANLSHAKKVEFYDSNTNQYEQIQASHQQF